MNEKSKEEMYRVIFNAVHFAALPDSEKMKLWEKAEKENPEYPIIPYYENIREGKGMAAGLFEKLRLDL